MFIISIMSLVRLLIAGFHFLIVGELLLGTSIASSGIAANAGILYFLNKNKKQEEVIDLDEDKKPTEADCFSIMWSRTDCGCL